MPKNRGAVKFARGTESSAQPVDGSQRVGGNRGRHPKLSFSTASLPTGTGVSGRPIRELILALR